MLRVSCCTLVLLLNSVKKKGTQTQLFCPDIFGWGAGLPREGYLLRNSGKPKFLAGYPGILPGYPGSVRKFEKKRFVFNSRPLIILM